MPDKAQGKTQAELFEKVGAITNTAGKKPWERCSLQGQIAAQGMAERWGLIKDEGGGLLSGETSSGEGHLLWLHCQTKASSLEHLLELSK